MCRLGRQLCRTGSYDGPVPNVIASTAGRAVSRRSKAGLGRFRPVPPQVGHFQRINATPSDLPFKSTGLATYPLPPQFGQSSGDTLLPPSWLRELSTTRARNSQKSVLRYESRTRIGRVPDLPILKAAQRVASGQNSRSPLSTWVYCSSKATLPIGTSTFASGKYVATQWRGIS